MQTTDLLKYLRCPNCSYENLIINKDRLVCKKCNTSFDIIDGVPVLFKKDRLSRQEEDQIKIFNSHYSKFSETEYNLENWRESMLNRIFETDFKSEIKTYLDVGCGATGYTVIEGAKRNDWLTIGVDSSLQAMTRAKKLADKQGVGDKTAFVVCSAENLPFKKNVFNYISAVSVLEHLDNDQELIKNVSSVLKETGYVYICVPNTYLKIWPFLWLFCFYSDLKVGHKRHYSIKKLDACFGVNNFKRNRVFYNGHLRKIFQIFLDKFKLIDNSRWWKMEEKDINQNSMGVQLNAIYFRN